MVLSLPAVLFQVGKSVPGVLGADRIILTAILNACIGMLQGVLGALVIPHLAQKLTSNKHVYMTFGNMLMNCLFPAAVIIGLDSACLGNWVMLWIPCRQNPESLRRTYFGPSFRAGSAPLSVLKRSVPTMLAFVFGAAF